tara:strand:- start:339 stop:500 length:162 start_codon:yes stop_codon:yes gene_type:complete
VGTGQDWKGPYWQARMRRKWIGEIGRGLARSSRYGRKVGDREVRIVEDCRGMD